MQGVLIWDKFIRCFHWATVSIVILNQFVLEDSWHNYCGFCLFGLLVARIVWGFYGSHNARFKSFFPTVSSVKQHLAQLQSKSVPKAEGHNPLGGLMILLLITMLFFVSITGWMTTLDVFFGVEWVEISHELAANVIIVLSSIHISAVLIMSKFTSRNLIKAMITGYRK